MKLYEEWRTHGLRKDIDVVWSLGKNRRHLSQCLSPEQLHQPRCPLAATLTYIFFTCLFKHTHPTLTTSPSFFISLYFYHKAYLIQSFIRLRQPNPQRMKHFESVFPLITIMVIVRSNPWVICFSLVLISGHSLYETSGSPMSYTLIFPRLLFRSDPQTLLFRLSSLTLFSYFQVPLQPDHQYNWWRINLSFPYQQWCSSRFCSALILLFISDLAPWPNNSVHPYADDSILHSSISFKFASSSFSRSVSSQVLMKKKLGFLRGADVTKLTLLKANFFLSVNSLPLSYLL